MKKVTGIGGIFFKCQDPEKMRNWYREHLGLETNEYGANFHWRDKDEPEKMGFTQWSAFPKDTQYFAPSDQEYMINYCVEDLEALAQELKKAGVTFVDEIEEYDYGKFLHILDAEGNKVELWQSMGEGF